MIKGYLVGSVNFIILSFAKKVNPLVQGNVICEFSVNGAN